MTDIFIASEKNEPAPKKNEDSKDLGLPKKTAEKILALESKGKSGFHIFSAFGPHPTDMGFKNQEKDEKILLFLRRSMITNIRWIVFSIILLLAPLFILPFIDPSKPLFFLPFRFIVAFVVFYYLLVAAYIYVSFITWYFNIALITNIRIIDVDFTGLIYKNVAATRLNLVQDVSYVQIGVIRTTFNYGDVFVQTAGTHVNFEFEAVPQPENVVHIVQTLIGEDQDAI